MKSLFSLFVFGVVSLASSWSSAQVLDPADFTFIARSEVFGVQVKGSDYGGIGAGDIDGDGDIDIVTHGYNLSLYENTGTRQQPNWAFPVILPANGLFYGASAIGDMDGDGDGDLVVGLDDGTLAYMENREGSFAERFPSVVVTNYANVNRISGDASPALVDMDGDGDLDLVIGENDDTNITYVQNIGTRQASSWASPISNFVPNLRATGSQGFITLADMNGDGDHDLFLGRSNGTLSFVANIGTPQSPVFNGQIGFQNYGSITLSNDISPAAVDMDGDGDFDFLVGNSMTGIVSYVENKGTASRSTFATPVNIGLSVSPLDITDVELADMDGDGDADLLIGHQDGTLSFLENQRQPGSAMLRFAAAQSDYGNGVDVGDRATVEAVDLNGDGLLDLLLGGGDGTLRFLPNLGTRQSARFDLQTLVTNYGNGLDVGNNSSPAAADVDGDGDFDLMVGDSQGTVRFLRNTGTPAAATFNDPAVRSIGSITIRYRAKVEMVDLDRDGDFDLLLSDFSGRFYLLENTGTASQMLFDGTTLRELPNRHVGQEAFVAAADMDGDGDLDFVLGSRYGGLLLVESVHPGTQEAGNCADSIDNDNDGAIDCADADCNGDAACVPPPTPPGPTPEICNNSQDDDGDGTADCADSDCATAENCRMTGGSEPSDAPAPAPATGGGGCSLLRR